MTPPSPLPFGRSPSHASGRTARVEAIFHEALSRAPAERAAFVAEASGGDESLEQEIERLLAAHEEAGAYFESPNSPEIEAELARLKPEEAGEMIGPYKLMEQIGQGGFGTVWVADQERPIRRRIALKIIKLGMDTKEVIARFEQERQALAMMDHPHIAKVFDAGATQWGRPFFVMELVRGIKITDYCDQANLATAERLALFIQVCNAVQHAHQKGIIHRDLKPSNILVTLHDGVPVPKVIDFGVAKATQQQRLTDLTICTQFQQMIGTPVYMSPEQAEMIGLDIDTRSDIYSLGILLYELLTGKPPFDAQTLASAGYEEMRRIIREVEPLKPSSKLSTVTGEERTTLAKARHVDPDKLSRMVAPDLDWVVMKALEKDRGRRYETANALATDIQRHLNNEPVLAGPPSSLYRARKYVRRHRGEVVFAVSVNAAVLLLACAAMVRIESTRFRGAMIRDLAILAGVLADNSAAAIQSTERSKEPRGVRATLVALQQHPHIVDAELCWRDGGIAVQFRRVGGKLEAWDRGGGRKWELSEAAGVAGMARFEGDRLVVSQPILFEGARIGTLHVRSDLDELNSNLQFIAGILLVVWLGSVVSSLLMALAFAPRLQARK